MPTPAIHAARRAELMRRVPGPILLMGSGDRPRNLAMNPVRFRQDSTFLYFTGCRMPGAAAVLHAGESTLFLPPPSEDDPLWHGHVESIFEQAAALGFSSVRPDHALESAVAELPSVATLAVPDLARTLRAAELSGLPLRFGAQHGTEALVETVIEMRRRLCPEELEVMRQTAAVTARAHRAAMAATRPGVHELQLAALFDAEIAAAGLVSAYESIVTVRGEILHNHHRVNTLSGGQLLLLDGGAEAGCGLGTDVTRTWPVSGRFTARQRAAYDAVLEAQRTAIDMVRPGTRYRDIHTAASRVLARFLADEGLLRCSVDEAIETGAHAVFFPHGVGHLIGLDVHDLENFGDRAAYAPGRVRSEQFGTAFLRLDLDLEPGNVVTIEPGFYIVPAILHDPTLRERFSVQVAFDRAESWIGFGGIRIEDDVATTEGAPDVITGELPTAPAAIEALVGQMEMPLGGTA